MRKAYLMSASTRFALLTIAAVASFAACSGAPSPVPNANESAALRSPQTAIVGVEHEAAKGTISLKPASVDVLVGKSAEVSVSEKRYEGKLASKPSSACSRIASWTPASGKGPVLRVTFTGKMAGSCVLTFADADKHLAHLKVTVQTSTATPSPSASPSLAPSSSPSSSPSASPSPANTLNPVPLFVSTGNTGARVVQIPVGCTSSSCQTIVGGGFVQPEGLTFDGSGNLYVADDSGGSLLPLYEVPPGCTSHTCVTSIDSFASSQSVAIDPSGNVYLAAENLYEIPNGCTMPGCVVTVVTGLASPIQLASDASGNIYIADAAYGLLEYVKGSSSTTETSLPFLTNAPATAVAVFNGKLYQAFNQQVQVADLSCVTGGGGLDCFTNLGGGFSVPTGLAVDPSGDVYVADSVNGTVYGVPPGCVSQTCTVTITPAGLAGARGIAIQVPGSPGARRRYASRPAEPGVLRRNH